MLKFDFIYVDGSHKCLDCHYDLLLSWLLLKKNGILAIDDVIWNLDTTDDPLNIPYYGCMHFFENIKMNMKCYLISLKNMFPKCQLLQVGILQNMIGYSLLIEPEKIGV
jgi:hypothetical protein